MESFFCLSKLCNFAACLLLLISLSFAYSSEALNPTGNITIKWDVMGWTPDGYVNSNSLQNSFPNKIIIKPRFKISNRVNFDISQAVVNIYNYQKHPEIKAPGWKLSWTWEKKEVIWAIIGSRTLYRGDCSMFKGNIPRSCIKNPTVVDLPPSAPFNQQIANCCKSGVLVPNSESAFQISVGRAGTTNRTVRTPRNFTFVAPRQAYVCGPPRIVKPTRFITADRRRVTAAYMTWNSTCVASQHKY